MIMPKKPYAPSQLLEKFVVRLPDGLRERIEVIAKENGRSMNNQVVRWLEERVGSYEASKKMRSIETDALTGEPPAGNYLAYVKLLHEEAGRYLAMAEAEQREASQKEGKTGKEVASKKPKRGAASAEEEL